MVVQVVLGLSCFRSLLFQVDLFGLFKFKLFKLFKLCRLLN